MTARNNITGDLIATKGTTDAYRDNYDRIFGKKKQQLESDIDMSPELAKLIEQEMLREVEEHNQYREPGIWFEDPQR